MDQVKNIIAVASGKGGVGKSTTSVNLALALQKTGARVGLLDADIYGPSQPMMLGIDNGVRPDQVGQHFIAPIIAHGLQTMSIGYLVTDDTAMAWRGPMAASALQQLLTQTSWDDLDYLVVDLPPGTGDIQLTLSQKVPVTGAVIVTTPQDIALIDGRKAIEMFSKVEVPVLGIVENMAVHICSSCGHQEHIFGTEGGGGMAEQYGIPLLGVLPLDLSIRENSDSGTPTVVSQPDSTIAIMYGNIAEAVVASLGVHSASSSDIPTINISDD